MEKEAAKESDNIIRVGVRRNWTFYTFLAKKLLMEHETVEFQALDTAITNAVEAAECLSKNKYATIEKIITDSIDMERKFGGTIKKAKIYITLKKGDDFQKIYDDYEKERDERLKNREEHEHEHDTRDHEHKEHEHREHGYRGGYGGGHRGGYRHRGGYGGGRREYDNREE